MKIKGRINDFMIERAIATNSEWEFEKDGYAILQGCFFAEVIYIALPKGHPDIGKDYDDLIPEVNGGLTFGEGNVFGWDYNHYENDKSFKKHIKNALEYFRKRNKTRGETDENRNN